MALFSTIIVEGWVIALLVLIQAGLTFGLKAWLQAEITEAVKLDFSKQLEKYKTELALTLEGQKSEFAKKLEDYKAQIKRHDQAVQVAGFLAKKVGGNAERISDHQAVWELSLWLPAPLVRQLTEFLAQGKNARPIKELLISLRKEIHGADDDLTADQIAHVGTSANSSEAAKA